MIPTPSVDRGVALAWASCTCVAASACALICALSVLPLPGQNPRTSSTKTTVMRPGVISRLMIRTLFTPL